MYSRHNLFRAFVLVLGLCASHGLATAASGDTGGLTTQRVASGLARPLYVTAPTGDRRLFILEQRGVIKLLKDGNVLSTPFLDIDDRVQDIEREYDERGLLGLVFDPDYRQNGFFYVNYYSPDDSTVVARYSVSANPDLADRTSELVIITIEQPEGNHNGGHIAFGPDGYLYIGMGDGGGAGDPSDNGQRDDTLLGKMLRIDVDGDEFPQDPLRNYAIPPTNPFAGPGLPLDEIWAKGMRNPYRWSFDRLTGDLWIGDVGQNLWEEIDFQAGGDEDDHNYGWRLTEGNHCFNPPSNCDPGQNLDYPVHEYMHGGGRCSVTGGYVYRGEVISELQGVYFFADFCTADIWSFRYVNDQVTEFTDREGELAPGGALTIDTIASFGEDGFGELYIVDRGAGTDGEVYRVKRTGTNQVPVCDHGGPYMADLGEVVAFDGTGSGDPDGIVTSYTWDFGDGSTGNGAQPTHAYGAGQIYPLSLCVTDLDNAVACCMTQVDVVTAVELMAFDVVAEGDAVRLRWTTARETDHAGFNVLRADEGGVHFIRLNTTLITTSNWATDGSAIYAFEDRTTTSGRTYAYVLEAIDLHGGAQRFPAHWVTAGSPREMTLSIHPNPADRRAARMTITFDLRGRGPVALTIYGARGERVRSLLDLGTAAGRHTVRWDGRDDRGRQVGAGVYFCHLEAGQARLVEKLLILP